MSQQGTLFFGQHKQSIVISLVVTQSIALIACWFWGYEKSREVCQLSSELDKQRELRRVERAGRISAQQASRDKVIKSQLEHGYTFRAIGHIESPFPDRRGTPRQPSLVPAATGRIRFDRSLVQLHHFEELREFSHVWVLFVFHANTNADKASSSTSGASSKTKTKAAKIKPPRLHGAKVGCLSTRSPHRPNDIGLSVCEVLGVGVDYLELRCLDMVDGTPVLDGESACHRQL